MKPYYEDAQVTLYCGDWREVLPSLAASSVDLVLTDPPYNVGKGYGRHNDALPDAEYRLWVTALLREAGRLTRNSVVYFPGAKNAPWSWEATRDAGLCAYRQLGWHKAEFAGDVWTAGPPMSWEPVIWAHRPDCPPFFNKRFGQWGRDFFVVPATHGDPFAKLHPCPKPLSVMQWLVGLFCPEGGTVFDPCAGTGTTLRAARDMGRRSIGVEIDPAYCQAAVTRLAQQPLPLAV